MARADWVARTIAAVVVVVGGACSNLPSRPPTSPPQPEIVIPGERIVSLNWLYLVSECSSSSPIPIETPEGDVYYVACWPAEVCSDPAASHSLHFTGQVLGRRGATARLSFSPKGLIASFGIDGRCLYYERTCQVPEGMEKPPVGWSYHRIFWADQVCTVCPVTGEIEEAPSFTCEAVHEDD